MSKPPYYFGLVSLKLLQKKYEIFQKLAIAFLRVSVGIRFGIVCYVS